MAVVKRDLSHAHQLANPIQQPRSSLFTIIKTWVTVWSKSLITTHLNELLFSCLPSLHLGSNNSQFVTVLEKKNKLNLILSTTQGSIVSNFNTPHLINQSQTCVLWMTGYIRTVHLIKHFFVTRRYYGEINNNLVSILLVI